MLLSRCATASDSFRGCVGGGAEYVGSIESPAFVRSCGTPGWAGSPLKRKCSTSAPHRKRYRIVVVITNALARSLATPRQRHSACDDAQPLNLLFVEPSESPCRLRNRAGPSAGCAQRLPKRWPASQLWQLQGPCLKMSIQHTMRHHLGRVAANGVSAVDKATMMFIF